MAFVRKSTFVSFSLCDDAGQFVNGVAIEVDHVNFHGMSSEGVLFDIYWPDGSAERRTLSGLAYGNFSIGTQKNRVVTFKIQGEYPPNRIVTKSEFHQMFGIERVRNEAGHFVLSNMA